MDVVVVVMTVVAVVVAMDLVVVVEVVVKESEVVVKVASDGINSGGARGYTSDTRLNCERDVAGVCKRDAGLH
jgi:hypothetical protein